MIAVLLTILKIIGIILLCILALILLILVTVLFVPIHYSADGDYSGKAAARVHVSWLCSIIRFNLTFNEAGLIYSLKLLWITIFPRAPKSKKHKKHKKHRKAPQKRRSEYKESVPERHDSIPERIPDSIQGASEIVNDKEPDVSSSSFASSAPQRKSFISRLKDKYKSFLNRLNKIRFKITGICDKIKDGKFKFDHYRDILEDEAAKRSVSELLFRVKVLCRHILPRRFRARLHFGLDDPAGTGELLGSICMFYPLYTDHIVLQPDFEQSCFDGDVAMKGHIQLIFVLITGIKLYFNKDIRKIYNKIR